MNDLSAVRRYSTKPRKRAQPKQPKKEAPVPDEPIRGTEIEGPTTKTPALTVINDAINKIDGILEGDRTKGKGARVTAEVKTLFRNVSKDFYGDLNNLIKNKDVASAKKLLEKLDDYIKFDRKISEKDYAQGSELVANRKNAMEFNFRAGISAEGNKRTEDLNVLKGMLQDFVGKEADLDTKALTQARKEAKVKAEGAPKLSKEEKLDAIADQVAKTFMKRRAGSSSKPTMLTSTHVWCRC